MPSTVRLGEPRILLCDGHGSYATTEFMYECFQSNVHIIYLPPHTSHILQPLDLSCFSAVKGQYRAQIASLARLEDSALIKKQQFILFYYQARTKGLTSRNIQSGFQAAGLVPYDPPKVLASHFITDRPTEATNEPQTPRRTTQIDEIQTPENRRQFEAIVRSVSSENQLPRSLRRLLFKTGKAFDIFHSESARQSIQIQSQEQQIVSYDTRKQQRVALNLNKEFARISNVEAIQEQAQTQPTTYEANIPFQPVRIPQRLQNRGIDTQFNTFRVNN